MNSNRPPVLLIKFLLVFVVILTGCQPRNSSADQGGNTTDLPIQSPPAQNGSGQTSNPGVINADILLDPALAQDADSLRISQYLYQGLVRLDSSGKVVPGLAESWVISDDQLDYIFKLRSTAAFSDGTFITPDIIAANFNRWFDPQSPLRGKGEYAAWQKTFLGFHNEKTPDNRSKSTVDGIQKVDFNTVLVHLNRPVPELLTYLADPAFAILDPAALSPGGYGKRESKIISSGPYVVSAWTDAGLTLSPNPKYWDKLPADILNFTWQ
jgi:ABC-type transport system substrate-binding protein